MTGWRGPVSVPSAQRRLMLLSATRWLPIGVVFGLTTLLPLERGITLTQLAVIVSAQGFVMLGLELPTGGLADAVGRRPVLLLAGVLGIVSGLLFLTSSGFWMFLAAMALQGVFRALNSGPLEAWSWTLCTDWTPTSPWRDHSAGPARWSVWPSPAVRWCPGG